MDVIIRFHQLFVSVLLVVVGALAFTPDPRSLASLNVFRVLCSVMDGSIPDQDSDDQPDEVSGPVHSIKREHRLKLKLSSTTDSAFASTHFPEVAMACNSSFSGSVRAKFLSRDGRKGSFHHIRC